MFKEYTLFSVQEIDVNHVAVYYIDSNVYLSHNIFVTAIDFQLRQVIMK